MRVVIRQDVEIKDLPQQLEEAFKLSGLTVKALCEQADISQSYWYRLRNGEEETISLEKLRLLEKVLNQDFGVEL